MDVVDSEGMIIELNYKNDLVDERLSDERFNSRKMFELLPESIVDKRTLKVIEIHDLFKAIDRTMTCIGSARLFHSLMNPSQSIELVHAKQDAFLELQHNLPLRQAIVTFLSKFSAEESDMFKYLNAHMHPMLAYGDYKRAMGAIDKMLAAVKKLPQPETVYLDSLFKSILSFNGSAARSLVKGPVLRTLHGVLSRAEKKFFTPSWRFSPRRFGLGAVVPALPGIYFGLAWIFGLLHPGFAKAMFMLTCWLSAVGVGYAALLKPMIDYETAILPVRKRLLDSNSFASAIEGVAAIDELLSFVQYSEGMIHPTVIPEVTNESSHFFVARDLRNPIQAAADENFVGNDVELTSARMSFVTGPNSGGKTTYCKSIVQNQILAQIGSPVVASAAMINMADKITYQAPAFDTLLDPEGRFGTELKVTRDIFYSVTPRSLVILDEIAEGTTTLEKMTFSVDIMKGFHAIGNNTMLVTHSHELVDKFRQEGLGQYLQVDFDDGKPTHKMVEGISRDSHALRVAQKINFSPEDMQKHLKGKGYL
jgi:DNA mismatch repair ATPase MutS